jgi:hypothetical protein
MRALLKSGEWVEIDTSCLFNNQYNTTEEYGNKRIFDGEIQRIEGDVRLGLGKCKYCGAIVSRNDEDKHFLDRESKGCDKCFWYRDRIISQEKPIKENKVVIVDLPDGTQKKTVHTTETRTTVYEKQCTYSEVGSSRTDCTNKECREYGIEWFTPDNCYFLKYPNGTDDYTLQDWIRNEWLGSAMRLVYQQYRKELGSYSLLLHLHSDEKTIDHLTLSNSRNSFRFTYNPDTDMYILYDGIKCSPREVKKLLGEGKDAFGRQYPKCNESVNYAVKQAVTDLYNKVKKVEKAGI